MINLVKRGTSQKLKWGWLLFYEHLGEQWKGRNGLRDCVAVKGILPCVGCVGIVDTKLDSLVDVSIALWLISLS